MTGEIDHVLAGATAGLDCIAGFASDELPQHRADRLVIAVKGRRVKPAVGIGTTTVVSEFNDILNHGSALDKMTRCCLLSYLATDRKAR